MGRSGAKSLSEKWLPEGLRSATEHVAISQTGSQGYWREISAVLVLKALAIGILYGLFFAPGDRPAVSAETVAAHLEESRGLK
jgi:hypothetical protein